MTLAAHPLIPLDRLYPSERNARKTFYGIEELSESIHSVGLLQNLVVSPGREVNGTLYYEVMAGERRLRALQLLNKQGRTWNASPVDGVSQIPCLVTDAPIDWVNLAENISRHELPIWQAGHRFCELNAAGYTQAQIAVQLQIHQARVSRYSTIARNLCPEVVHMLETTRGFPWKENDLIRMANLIDRHQQPDASAQLAMLSKLLEDPKAHGRTRRRPSGMKNDAALLKQTVVARYERLKKGEFGSKLTVEQVQWIAAIVRYLDGRDKHFKLA